MRLKRLETFGFKSFADRMTFDFEDGITAVIGPNGCGKSNIVDSIKWVIGEQSAKALRGEDMTDVIFNGCATRRGMAMAEVTLVLDQVGVELGHLANGEETGDEVAITRRLTRDGASTYYLNGKSCRLKDIKELFMDTGVGTAAYSVIEQGRVGFILESNTKDRRIILEEAAGISRYKARRKVALRKLERVELDLQRIGEVLGEVRRRVKAVTRQAQAALRYQDLSAQVRELRMAFALEEYGRLSEELAGHGARSDELAARGAEIAAKLGELEAALAGADLRLVALENDIRALEQTRADAQSRRDVADSRARDAKYRLVEIDQQETQDQQALAALGAKIEALGVEHANAEQSMKAVETGGDGDTALGASLRTRREELDLAMAEVDAIINQVEDAKAKQVECLRELSRVEAEQGRVESARNATGERRKRLEDRSGGQTEVLVQARLAEAAAKAALNAGIAAAAEGHGKLDEYIRARETALAEGNRLDNELNEFRHQEARAETGLRLLQEQERRAEGVFRGVKDVLQQMDKFPGIIGMVADLCRVPDDYVVAIETALGGQAQNIVTETQEAARDAIAFLKRERRGRATFLPLDDIQGGERISPEVLREAGVVGIASRLVEFEPRYKGAFEHLLGNVLVVETLDHAIALRRRHRVYCRLVTIDGDVINPGGAMTGGRQQGAEAGGLVGRKNEIRKLDEQLKELAAKKQAVGAARDLAKKQGFELSLRVEEQRRAIQQADRNVGEAKAQLMKTERDRLHLEEATSSFGAELEEIAAEMAKIDAEARDLLGQREWFGALNRKLGVDIERLQGEMEAKAQHRNRIQEEVNNLRVSLATTQERQEAVRNHLSHLVRSLQELEDQKGERERRLASHGAKRIELRQVQEDNARTFAEESALVAQFAEQLGILIKERDGLRNGVEEQRQESRALAGRQRAIEQERNHIEVKVGEARVRLEGLNQRILDDYQLVLAEAFANYQRPADLDWPKLRNELAATEKELAALGPVNLAAIDELKEVEARAEFLDQQFTDLGNAAEKLKEIIEQINDVSRRLFQTTYREVRKNFQELFRKLFGGGKADLVLEQPEAVTETTPDGEVVTRKPEALDILEAGLEIVAQPPGKNPKIITQLSGGEKALTAIALLFAVYQTKPSPFCILDEVDAPLDEANVDVYCSMLREFVRDSQFIVITHKKRTMQRADAIYGITQNEPGVSTKISVKFEEVHKLGELDGATGQDELSPTVRGAGPYAG
jgi:chromosome segregation protein